MSNQEQRGRGFWIGLAIIFILSFLTTYALAEEPIQIPVEEDFFIGQIVNVHTGSWGAGQIVNYNSAKDLYGIQIDAQEIGKPDDKTSTAIIYRKGSQLKPRSNRRSLQVLPNNPPIQNIKAEVEEIKPEFKFKQGDIVIVDKNTPMIRREDSRIIGRAVLWGTNVYHIQSAINAPAWDGQIHRQTTWDIVEESDLNSPPKEEPEYVEGLQP